MAAIQTSKGLIDLTAEEHALLARVLSGSASMAEGQHLYQSTSARGLPFPMEWEVHVLRATVAELRTREDLIQRLGVERRAATILALHDTLMSAPSPDLVLVADLGLRQFRRMLDDPALTDAQAMGVYDALHSLYFAGVTDVLDLRRFDAIVPPFENWLSKRCGPGS